VLAEEFMSKLSDTVGSGSAPVEALHANVFCERLGSPLGWAESVIVALKVAVVLHPTVAQT